MGNIVTFRKHSSGLYLQLDTFRSHLITKWPPQPVDLGAHQNGSKQANFTDSVM